MSSKDERQASAVIPSAEEPHHDNSESKGDESVYSMDSFLADLPPDPGEVMEQTEAEARNFMEYFSPSSGTTSDASRGQTDSTKARHRKQPLPELPLLCPQLQQPTQETIERVAKQQTQQTNDTRVPRKMSTDSIPSIKPVHNFLGAAFAQDNDSDLSDGSLVFKTPPEVGQPQGSKSSAPSKQSSKQIGQHNRFPSFDSLGSSGSVRYVPTNRPQQALQRLPQTTPVNPAILPYHERRKLQRRQEEAQKLQQKQQRSQEEKEQQQQQLNQQAPPPPPPSRPDRPGGMPFLMQPPPHPTDMGYYQPPPQQMGFPPYPAVLHPHQMPNYPIHPASSPIGMYHPQFPFPPPGYQFPYPPFQQPPPLAHNNSNLPPPPADKVAENPRQRPPVAHKAPGSSSRGITQQQQMQQLHQEQMQLLQQQQQQLMQQQIHRQQMTQHQQRSRPPVPSYSNTRDSVGSSFDSSETNERGSRRSSDVPPPPPPPPPPSTKPSNSNSAPLGHVRQESTGSVSSLGSIDQSSGYDERGRSSRRKNSSGTSFFQRLNPFSPPSADKKQPTVDDFHRKNQAFLSSVPRPNQQGSPQLARRVSLSSLDRPPASSGGHQRLDSIDNDDWEEKLDKKSALGDDAGERKRSKTGNSREVDESVVSSGGDITDDEAEYDKTDEQSDPDETTKLLPPTGISSNEYYDMAPHGHDRSSSHHSRNFQPSRYQYSSNSEFRDTFRASNTISEHEEAQRRSKKKKKKHRSRRHDQSGDLSVESVSSASSREYQRWMKKRSKLLEKERVRLVKQWRNEIREEEEQRRRLEESNRWYNRLFRCIADSVGVYFDQAFTFLVWAEAFVANVPLTIGAIALAIATMGVVWFKFTEETLSSCEPVHFHSAQCSFPEFPGCFYCDTSNKIYNLALHFHWICSSFAALLGFTFVAKLLFARRVVFDEMSSPTTASPAGLICMTMDIVFAGRGFLGMLVVSVSCSIHLCMCIWFIYMSLAYRIMPEPSWFPNTIGIGMGAVKVWLYYPMAGHFLMAISLSLNLFFFPISLIRVALNKKISATVCWMQMSAPSISLYALTIMAQPSFEEEHPDINNFQRVHRKIYLPLMHILFALCIIGMLASVISLLVRWTEFRKLPFSPAHAAFCAPTLTHVNAVQAYRGALNSFSTLSRDSPFILVLNSYWIFLLISGTIVTIVISAKFLLLLPEWTHIDTEGEIEPPAPYETAMSLSRMALTGEVLVQNYVSPAILQANETGVLVLSRDQRGHQRYRRTRKVTALGFEPIMNMLDMERERELLLEYVGNNPPRQRHRTLSVPGIDFSYQSMGTGQGGVFDLDYSGQASPWAARTGRRKRAQTAIGAVSSEQKREPPSVGDA